MCTLHTNFFPVAMQSLVVQYLDKKEDKVTSKLLKADETGLLNYRRRHNIFRNVIANQKSLLDAELKKRQCLHRDDEELIAAIDKIAKSALNAGMEDFYEEFLYNLFLQMARNGNPENPAEYFKAHPLVFANAGKKRQKGYLQDETAEQVLQRDEALFSQNVDSFLNGTLPTGSYVPVMTTPLALKVVGADLKPVEVSYAVLNKILNVKHPEIDANIIKQLPRALTDPVMIFKTYPGKTGNTRVVAMLELQDNNGAIIVVPVELLSNSQNNAYQINKLTSAFGKTDKKTNLPSNDFFIKKISNGEVLYMNEKKTTSWAGTFGVYFPTGQSTSSLTTDSIKQYNPNVKTEVDLKQLKNQYPGYYQGDNANAKGMISWTNEGKAIISLFKGADASTVIHETGHYFVENFMNDSALETATAQAKNDRQALLDYVGMTSEQWASVDVEGKRKAHEKLTSVFGVYIYYGVVPENSIMGILVEFELVSRYLSITRDFENIQKYLS